MNRFWGRCGCCGKEIQINPTVIWNDNTVVCLPCKTILYEHGFKRGEHFPALSDSYWMHPGNTR